jgi:hypothetical protein
MFETLNELLRRTVPATRLRAEKRPVGKALLIAGAVIMALLLVVAALSVG